MEYLRYLGVLEVEVVRAVQGSGGGHSIEIQVHTGYSTRYALQAVLEHIQVPRCGFCVFVACIYTRVTLTAQPRFELTTTNFLSNHAGSIQTFLIRDARWLEKLWPGNTENKNRAEDCSYVEQI